MSSEPGPSSISTSKSTSKSKSRRNRRRSKNNKDKDNTHHNLAASALSRSNRNTETESDDDPAESPALPWIPSKRIIKREREESENDYVISISPDDSNPSTAPAPAPPPRTHKVAGGPSTSIRKGSVSAQTNFPAHSAMKKRKLKKPNKDVIEKISLGIQATLIGPVIGKTEKQRIIELQETMSYRLRNWYNDVYDCMDEFDLELRETIDAIRK